jgi:hypothetical protein
MRPPKEKKEVPGKFLDTSSFTSQRDEEEPAKETSKETPVRWEGQERKES